MRLGKRQQARRVSPPTVPEAMPPPRQPMVSFATGPYDVPPQGPGPDGPQILGYAPDGTPIPAYAPDGSPTMGFGADGRTRTVRLRRTALDAARPRWPPDHGLRP